MNGKDRTHVERRGEKSRSWRSLFKTSSLEILAYTNPSQHYPLLVITSIWLHGTGMILPCLQNFPITNQIHSESDLLHESIVAILSRSRYSLVAWSFVGCWNGRLWTDARPSLRRVLGNSVQNGHQTQIGSYGDALQESDPSHHIRRQVNRRSAPSNNTLSPIVFLFDFFKYRWSIYSQMMASEFTKWLVSARLSSVIRLWLQSVLDIQFGYSDLTLPWECSFSFSFIQFSTVFLP